jgi:hypothetical protein
MRLITEYVYSYYLFVIWWKHRREQAVVMRLGAGQRDVAREFALLYLTMAERSEARRLAT